MSLESILVLGAGELGLSVLDSLVSHNPTQSLTVLLRPSTITNSTGSKAAEIEHLKSIGISLLPGDLVSASKAELTTLFAPFHTVISCTGFVGGRGNLVKVAQAALDARVKRFFPWQFGVDYDVIGRGSPQDLFDEQLDVRELLRSQSATEWVIISVGMFTSFLFESFFGVVDTSASEKPIVRALGSWDTKVTLTTPEDIGRMTTGIVNAKEPRFKNEVVFVAGDTVTYGQVADVVESVLGKEVERSVWSVEELKGELEKDPENVLWKYRAVFAMGKGVAWDIEGTFNKKHGFKLVSMEEWAKANLKK